MTDPLLTVADVARLIQFDPEAVRRALRRGELVGSRLLGEWRVQPAELDRWIAAMAGPPPAVEVAEPIRARALPKGRAAHSVREVMREQQGRRA